MVLIAGNVQHPTGNSARRTLAMMPLAFKPHFPVRNQILAGLPRDKYPHLFSNLRLMSLKPQEVLYDMEDNFRCAYFMNYGVASFISFDGEGDSIEVGSVGSEGMIGIPIVLRETRTPYRVIVQVEGEALVVSSDVLRYEFDREGELRERLLRYTHALSTYMSQLGVCNHFHTVEKRLCRWLLLTSDRLRSNNFELTHESLSEVLGTGRSGVTMAAIKIQRSGLIRYQRGKITILNRTGMETATCDCYRISVEVFERFLSLNSQPSSNAINMK